MKKPPLEGPRRRLEHPVQLEPIRDVVVTSYRDEAAAVAGHILLNRVRSNLRDLPINHGRELIHDDRIWELEQPAREVHPELLPIGEHAYGRSQAGIVLNPTAWHTSAIVPTESDGAKSSMTDFPDQDSSAELAENVPRDGALPAS